MREGAQTTIPTNSHKAVGLSRSKTKCQQPMYIAYFARNLIYVRREKIVTQD